VDQDYLTSVDSYFNDNTSPPPFLSSEEGYPRPVFRHGSASIVQSKSEGSGVSGFSVDSLLPQTAPVHHTVDSSTHQSFASRRGHLSSSLERTHHVQNQPPHLRENPYHHRHHVNAYHPHHPYTQKRAGSTPPAPHVDDGGHISALRFAEHKRHSHSASQIPSYSQSNSLSSSRTSFPLHVPPDEAAGTTASPVVVSSIGVVSAVTTADI